MTGPHKRFPRIRYPAVRGWTYLAKVDADWRAKRDTAPLPLLRWAAAAIAIAGRWAAGTPQSLTGWIAPGAFAVLMLLPDLSSVAFGGLKLETRQTRDEVRKLGDKVQQLQVAAASATGNMLYLNIGGEQRRALEGSTAAATTIAAAEGAGKEHDGGTLLPGSLLPAPATAPVDSQPPGNVPSQA